jgi:hypothetical protein
MGNDIWLERQRSAGCPPSLGRPSFSMLLVVPIFSFWCCQLELLAGWAKVKIAHGAFLITSATRLLRK